MKNKKILGALAGLTFASCVTITPKGSIDIAYVPSRIDDQRMKNEIMTELDIGLEANVIKGRLKNTKIEIGGAQRTYITPGINFSFPEGLFSYYPNRQEYDIYGKVKKGNLEFYAEHMCSHPVDNESYWLYNEKTGKRHILNYDDITKIGLRLEF